MKVVELAGGVGGAKLAEGLATHLGSELTVVVNTGDDLDLYGLAIWPDHDTVAYTLAGLDDEVRGWGLRDETWTVMAGLAALGDDPWFRLGDRDLGTHLWRTDRLRAGSRPTAVALELRERLGFAATILPMADEPVRTEVRTDDGWLEFQEYFVHRHQAPDVHDVRFRGIEAGLQTARSRGAPAIAVSGIVGGRALKGPADRMLVSLGHESSALGVARLYAEWVDTFVIDTIDADLAPAIQALGLRVVVTDTIMTDDAARTRLAGDVLRAAIP